MATDMSAAYLAAIGALGLPDWLTWSVQVNPRRKRVGVSIEPGGSVLVSVPPGASAERVADVVRLGRGEILRRAVDMRDHGAWITTKELVSGEGFPLLGVNYRLRLVDDSDTGRQCPCSCKRLYTERPGVPIFGGPGHHTWSGSRTWQLTLRRDAATAATVIEWYRAEGQRWLDKHVPAYAQRAQVAAGLRWQVRPRRAGEGYGGTWGTYLPASHTIRLSWLIFQFPERLVRYIVAHEVAHAALRGQRVASHGREWERMVERLEPSWRGLHGPAKSAKGLPIWTGDVAPRAADSTAEPAPEPAPEPGFVSAWAMTLGGTR